MSNSRFQKNNMSVSRVKEAAQELQFPYVVVAIFVGLLGALAISSSVAFGVIV
ncbi:MAG: hypothetical protein RJQ07_12970 [Pseudomonadales bacterium]